MNIFSALYGLGIAVRNVLYDRGILKSSVGALPSIVVGNITVGGNGKSPVAQALCLELQRLGHRPALLLRGYKGREVGPKLVEAGDTPQDVGDEACMHFSLLGQIPIVVSRDRVAGIQFIKDKNLGEIVVLDDGLQHRRLVATVNLALLDERSAREIEDGTLLPAGTLREPLSAVRKRIDALVLVERGAVVEKPKWFNGPAFKASIVIAGARELYTSETVQLAELRNLKVIALSSIAKPEQFEEMLRERGIELVDVVRGRDHENWDLTLDARLKKLEPDVVLTTEKDAVKLMTLPKLSVRVVVVRIGAQLEEGLLTFIMSRRLGRPSSFPEMIR